MTHHSLLEAGFAPCATTDPEVFHDDAHADVAKKLCAECPLTAYCRAQARTNREWGTWGGETSEERAKAGHPPRGWHLLHVRSAAFGGTCAASPAAA